MSDHRSSHHHQSCSQHELHNHWGKQHHPRVPGNGWPRPWDHLVSGWWTAHQRSSHKSGYCCRRRLWFGRRLGTRLGKLWLGRRLWKLWLRRRHWSLYHGRRLCILWVGRVRSYTAAGIKQFDPCTNNRQWQWTIFMPSWECCWKCFCGSPTDSVRYMQGDITKTLSTLLFQDC